jgi:hypothetical protein
MPLIDDLDDEPEILDHWKFDDCSTCLNRLKVRTCRACDSGEFFEEAEPAGLDTLFHD